MIFNVLKRDSLRDKGILLRCSANERIKLKEFAKTRGFGTITSYLRSLVNEDFELVMNGSKSKQEI